MILGIAIFFGAVLFCFVLYGLARQAGKMDDAAEKRTGRRMS